MMESLLPKDPSALGSYSIQLYMSHSQNSLKGVI